MPLGSGLSQNNLWLPSIICHTFPMSCPHCSPKNIPPVLPKVGQKIRWYGTEYIVDAIHSPDVVVVTLGNGYQSNLWWQNNEGCKILSWLLSTICHTAPAMNTRPITVTDNKGVVKDALLVICPKCEHNTFSIIVIDLHNHLQCMKCSESFCQGGCDHGNHDEEEEEETPDTCPNCGSGIFNEKGDCQKCGL